MEVALVRHYRQFLWIASAALLLLSGCTGPCQYIRNGFKVGPNYQTPPAPIADHWIDAADQRVRSECDDLSAWWTVFKDPLLDQLINNAYQQNLTLREAGFRVLEARAQYGIAVGTFFPQLQDWEGSYRRNGVGLSFTNRWSTSFNLAWELDFWGRFRRAIASADDSLDASVFNYDDVLVTLLGDIADSYVQYRTDEERIRLLERTVGIQTDVYNFIVVRLKFGKVTELDRAQAESDLKQSLAQIAQLKIDMRLSQNRICTLLGIPTIDLDPVLNGVPNQNIPEVPNSVIVGVPADLLRRRPDVRRQERLAAAQGEQIGIAEAALYPAFTLNGTLGWQAGAFKDLFRPEALAANAGPSFQWNLLNYGRLLNNVRLQDATFKELVATYQETVIEADEEVENGIVTFLQSQDRARLLKESVDASYIALEVIIAQYESAVQGTGNVDFNRYSVIQQNLIQQQDLWAQARGQVDQGLIQIYRALGGGWQIRLGPPSAPPLFGPDGQPILVQPMPNAKPEEVVKPAPEALPQPDANAKPMPPDAKPMPPTMQERLVPPEAKPVAPPAEVPANPLRPDLGASPIPSN